MTLPTSITIRIAAVACALLSCGLSLDADAAIKPVRQHSGVDARLRGISAVDARVAWASGQNGTVLRTVDGGAHWVQRPVPDAQGLDFRDVEAFDADTAVILAIGPGDASRIYRTVDGGATWTQVLRNRDPRAFFDCMAFDGARGWMLGDPVDGHFQLYATTDGGRQWVLTRNGPEAADGDAAFAASGTCIAYGHGTLAIATGGPQPSLRFRRDRNPVWEKVPAPMFGSGASAGVFSLAARGTADAFVAVGGDYRAETRAAAAVTTLATAVPGARKHDDGTASDVVVHALGPLPSTSGYRSGVACRSEAATCIAVGPTGVERLRGDSWVSVSSEGFDAVSIAGSVGWMVGNDGRISRIALED